LEGIQDEDGNLGVEPIDGIIVCRHGLITKDNGNWKVYKIEMVIWVWSQLMQIVGRHGLMTKDNGNWKVYKIKVVIWVGAN
jgi:hypothetical protein